MREVAEDKEVDEEIDTGNGSDISGYHSDSESAVMTSGNSPFISKEARYSFLSRSGKKAMPPSYWGPVASCIIVVGKKNVSPQKGMTQFRQANMP